MKKKNVIYRILNIINGKCYIGKAKDFDKRIKEHLLNINKIKSPLYASIKSYGVENFNIEVIHEASLYEELDNLEIKYIMEYNSIYPNGYNLTSGGTGGDTITNNPNKDMSLKNRKGKIPWNKGLKGFMSGEQNGNFGNPTNFKGNSTSFKSGKDHRYYGKKQSDETIKKKVQNTDWKKRSENFPWEQKAKKCMKPIDQYNIEGEFIKTWDSITTISKQLGIPRHKIKYSIDKEKLLLNSIWKNKN
jgi:group I intron endonuclease